MFAALHRLARKSQRDGPHSIRGTVASTIARRVLMALRRQYHVAMELNFFHPTRIRFVFLEGVTKPLNDIYM